MSDCVFFFENLLFFFFWLLCQVVFNEIRVFFLKFCTNEQFQPGNSDLNAVVFIFRVLWAASEALRVVLWFKNIAVDFVTVAAYAGHNAIH